jgi:RNA polymerase sigma-70 factor (ECF subfamily)
MEVQARGAARAAGTGGVDEMGTEALQLVIPDRRRKRYMVPERSRRSSGRSAGVPWSGAGDVWVDGHDDAIARESETIARRYLEGDPDSIRTVTEWARAIAANNVWGFENTEDIVQSTLLALVQNLREGRFSGGNLRAYVRRIAKNMCISHYRKIRTRGSHVSFDEKGQHLSCGGSGEDIEHRNLVDSIFKRLNEACRQIILLAYLQGYSRKEISKRLGITEEAARVRLHRCIRFARSLLNGFGDVAMEQG